MLFYVCQTVLSLEFVDLHKEMGTNCVFMKQFAVDKLPKDTICSVVSAVYTGFFLKETSVLKVH